MGACRVKGKKPAPPEKQYRSSIVMNPYVYTTPDAHLTVTHLRHDDLYHTHGITIPTEANPLRMVFGLNWVTKTERTIPVLSIKYVVGMAVTTYAVLTVPPGSNRSG